MTPSLCWPLATPLFPLPKGYWMHSLELPATISCRSQATTTARCRLRGRMHLMGTHSSAPRPGGGHRRLPHAPGWAQGSGHPQGGFGPGQRSPNHLLGGGADAAMELAELLLGAENHGVQRGGRDRKRGTEAQRWGGGYKTPSTHSSVLH